MTNRLTRPSLIALAVSLSALGSGFALAAEMDHSAMGHGAMPMDHSQMPKEQASPEKSPAIDHSKMNHGAMQPEMGTMDHAQMGHGKSDEKAPAMDHSKMGHGAMDHSQMNHGSAEAPRTTSRTPIPVLTDADRQAAFPPLPGHQVHDSGINSFFLLDQLEYQDADEGSTLAWDASGWVGGDINRIWFRLRVNAPTA